MQSNLHNNARTTPAIRREIQAFSLSASQLAARHGISKATALQWKKRDSIEDLPHTPHNFSKTMSDQEEFVVIELRTSLLLALDDLLVIVRTFINPNVSRSGLTCCLRRHGFANLKTLYPVEEKEVKPKNSHKDNEPGFVHVDVNYLPKMRDETSRRYLFVAIDRASRWVYREIMPDKSAESAARLLKNLNKASPCNISKVLTDKGKEFTDRFDNDIEHRLTKPRHRQTNGMVERFHGGREWQIEEVLKQTRFADSKELELTIKHYEKLYNGCIPQKMIGHRTPLDALRQWQRERPELFVKKIYNLTGPDI